MDRRLVDAAVVLSPASHRDTRREQWLADLDGADELGMSATRIAIGACTTALFHRRAPHRTNWRTTMTTTAHAASHTVRTVPLLIGTAIATMLLGVVLVALSARYDGSPLAKPGIIVVLAFGALVPAACLAGAILLLPEGSRRRRRTAAACALLLGVAYLAASQSSLPTWVGPVAVADMALALWFLVVGCPRRGWWLLAVPAAAAILAAPLSNAWDLDGTIPTVAVFAIILSADVVPFLGAVVAAVVVARLGGRESRGDTPDDIAPVRHW